MNSLWRRNMGKREKTRTVPRQRVSEVNPQWERWDFRAMRGASLPHCTPGREGV